MRSLDLGRASRITQIGSPIRGSQLGTFGLPNLKKETMRERGKDQPPRLQTQHWFWYLELQENGSMAWENPRSGTIKGAKAPAKKHSTRST